MMMNQSASTPAVTETNKRDNRGRPYNCGADVMHITVLVPGQGAKRQKRGMCFVHLSGHVTNQNVNHRATASNAITSTTTMKPTTLISVTNISPSPLSVTVHIERHPTPNISCPIWQYPTSEHVHIDHPRFQMMSGSDSSITDAPPLGELCFFTRPDGLRFLGRATRVIEWQSHRAVLRIEHYNELASFGLVVPYPKYYQGWRLGLLQTLALVFGEDSEQMSQGK